LKSKEKNMFVAVVAVFLLACMTIILGMQIVTNPLTGFATNNAIGIVNITIFETLSITLSDSAIDLGTCEIDIDRGYALISTGGNDSDVNNADCYLNGFPDYFVIENDGTWPANVTLRINQSPQDFFGEPSAWLAYKAINWSGCRGGLQDTYVNLSSSNITYPLCSNFLPYTSNLFNVSLLAYIPANVSTRGSMPFLFVAEPIS